MPFILKAGKALNERKVEIRIQFRPPAAELNQSLDPLRNELVIRLQPDEAIYLKIVRTHPPTPAPFRTCRIITEPLPSLNTHHRCQGTPRMRFIMLRALCS